jgi:hypothetical protein
MHTARFGIARKVLRCLAPSTGRRSFAIVAVLAAAALSLTACGSKNATPTTDVSSVSGANTTVKLDDSLLSTLSSLKITPSVSGGIVFNQTTWTLPITGGHFAIYPKTDADPPVQGELLSSNGTMTLQSGSTTVKLTDLKVELFTDPAIEADIQVGSADPSDNVQLVQFDGKTVSGPQVDQSSGTITLSGGQGYLSADAADKLNTAFNTTVLKGGVGTGTKIGTGTIVIDTGSSSG